METCTAQGHVVGMLDRDQRTAKTCNFDRNAVFAKDYNDGSPDQSVISRRNDTISHRAVPGRTSPHSSCKTRKTGHFSKSLHRLKHALIVGAYLSLVTFPGILSAPTLRKSMENAEPKWLNPCGNSRSGSVNGTPGHTIPLELLLAQINTSAEIAESRAETFKEDFVRKTFNMDVQQLHNYYKEKDYDWLPTKNIPKKLGEDVTEEHLESLELNPTLLTVYKHLQMIAVGMEQIVEDEEKREGMFKSSFKETEQFLISLLCEINIVIVEKELTIEENVSRDIMGPEYRNMDNTSMNVRNWIIYRDYLNMLAYIKQVFDHFRGKLPKSD